MEPKNNKLTKTNTVCLCLWQCVGDFVVAVVVVLFFLSHFISAVVWWCSENECTNAMNSTTNKHIAQNKNRMTKLKHHRRARGSNRMTTIWNVLLICYFIEMANNVALSIIEAQGIEDNNMGNKI